MNCQLRKNKSETFDIGKLFLDRTSPLRQCAGICGHGFKPSDLLLTESVLACPHINSLAALCIEPTGLPPTSWDLNTTFFHNFCFQFVCVFQVKIPIWGEVN